MNTFLTAFDVMILSPIINLAQKRSAISSIWIM